MRSFEAMFPLECVRISAALAQAFPESHDVVGRFLKDAKAPFVPYTGELVGFSYLSAGEVGGGEVPFLQVAVQIVMSAGHVIGYAILTGRLVYPDGRVIT